MVRNQSLLLLVSSIVAAIAAPFESTSSPVPKAINSRGAEITGLITRCNTNTAIGFDDGPYDFQRQLVDGMKSVNATGTFFVNGLNWRCIYDQPMVDNLRHAHEAGFTIASHTWNHYDIARGSTEKLGESLDFVEDALWKILGVKPAMFRPPYGSINPENLDYLNSRGYTVVLWSDDTRDTMGESIQYSEDVMNRAKDGTLLLAHEIVRSTVEQVIPNTIPGLVKRGVNFVPIDQCLGIRPYQKEGGDYGTRDATWTCNGKPFPGQ